MATRIKEMIHQVVSLGKRAQTGFKREAWDAAVAVLNKKFKLTYDREHLKTRSIQVNSCMHKH
jgi:hypothetical protein